MYIINGEKLALGSLQGQTDVNENYDKKHSSKNQKPLCENCTDVSCAQP